MSESAACAMASLPFEDRALPAASLSPVEGFRLAMRELASGVSIVTCGRGRARTGLTATSLSSLSAEPPAVVVSINRSGSVLPVLGKAGVFGVNILTSRHRLLADRFAGRHGASGANRYHGANWTELETGAPILMDALAALDCRVEQIVEWQTHALVIGSVQAVRLGDGAALAYWRGGYVSL